MRCPRCNFEGEPLDGGCARCGYGRSQLSVSSSSLPGREITVTGPLGLIVRPLIRGDALRQGRYRVVEQLSLPKNQQEQGRAWLANDAQALSRLVIVREVIPTQENVGRLELEVRAMAHRLAELGQYPGFPHLIDMFSERGNYYLVLQHPDGKSLAQLVQQQGGALPERVVVEYGRQLCEILQTMSAQQPPLVHGSINPDTVIVSPDGRQVTLTQIPLFPPLLPADFKGKTLAGYLAPEQLDGVTDTRTDLYGLAATLYHALTGYDPALHMAYFYPPARRLNTTVSPRMEALLSRGLRSTISQRYARPADMLRDLQALGAASGNLGSATSGITASMIRPTRRSSTTRSTVLPFMIVAILIFVLIVGGILFATSRGPTSTIPDPQITATANAQQANLAQQAQKAADAFSAEQTLEAASVKSQGIGISDGHFVFDTYQGRKDVALKLRAAQAPDIDTAASALAQAIALDPTDAEAQIYNADLQIVQNGLPSVTIVLGIGFDQRPEVLASQRAMLQAAFVAQYEINEFGLLPHKQQLRLMIAGSGADPNSVAKAANFISNRVIKADNLDHIIGVVGWPDTTQTLKARDQIEAAHIPLVAQNIPDLNLTGSPYFFRVSPSYTLQATALGAFAIERLHAHNILVLRSTDNTGSALATAFEASVQSRHQLVIQHLNSQFTSQTTTPEGYLQIINGAIAAKSDLIYMPGTAVDALRLSHQIGNMARLQPANKVLANLKVIGGSPLVSNILLGQGDTPDALLARTFPQDVQRLYFTSYADPSEWNSIAQIDWPTLFTDWTGLFQNQVPGVKGVAADNAPPPDQYAILTYDAVRVIIKAASSVSGPLTGEAVHTILGALGVGTVPAFQGASGRIVFDPRGNPTDKAVAVLTIALNKGATSFTTAHVYGTFR